MLIEIDESVVENAKNNDITAQSVLTDLSLAQLYCYHIIWAKRSVLLKIIELSNILGNLCTNTYKNIFNKYATRGSIYKNIKYRALITYKENSHRDKDIIYINPKENPYFKYSNESVLLAENLDDIKLFEIIANYKLKNTPLKDCISINIDKDQGGGDTTCNKYNNYIKDKKKFCFAILDGDKKYGNCEYGDTYRKVKNIDRDFLPFNCICYGTTDVREVENLIPEKMYLEDANYKNNKIISQNIKFDKSYFDLKEGLYYKIFSDKRAVQYWTKNLSNYCYYVKLIKYIYNLSSANHVKLKDKFGEDVFIDGFGKHLLTHTIKNIKDLGQFTKRDLTTSQNKEWNRIGDLIINWGCSLKSFEKNSL